MIWSSASASQPCLDYPWRDMISVPHFCFANSSKDVKFRFRTSVLPWPPRSEFQLSHFHFARTSKGLKPCFHTSALPWLPKIWVPLSALLFCQDFERSQVPLPHAKDVQFCFLSSAVSSHAMKYKPFRETRHPYSQAKIKTTKFWFYC